MSQEAEQNKIKASKPKKYLNKPTKSGRNTQLRNTFQSRDNSCHGQCAYAKDDDQFQGVGCIDNNLESITNGRRGRRAGKRWHGQSWRDNGQANYLPDTGMVNETVNSNYYSGTGNENFNSANHMFPENYENSCTYYVQECQQASGTAQQLNQNHAGYWYSDGLDSSNIMPPSLARAADSRELNFSAKNQNSFSNTNKKLFRNSWSKKGRSRRGLPSRRGRGQYGQLRPHANVDQGEWHEQVKHESSETGNAPSFIENPVDPRDHADVAHRQPCKKNINKKMKDFTIGRKPTVKVSEYIYDEPVSSSLDTLLENYITGDDYAVSTEFLKKPLEAVNNRQKKNVRKSNSNRAIRSGSWEGQREALIAELCQGAYECAVCCDRIFSSAPVWSCAGCFHIFHLSCIKKWARSTTSQSADQSGWRCPSCQTSVPLTHLAYFCFCGKVENPELNRYETPHSCGTLCGRKQGNQCLHACTVLCHPGPCPMCEASVTRVCSCGKQKQQVKCGNTKTITCGETCNKLLDCNRHCCGEKCHLGLCAPCEIKIEQSCHCSKTKRSVLCSSEASTVDSFSCNSLCHRPLECGKHNCQQICHDGDCSECLLSPSLVKTCPCGKTKIETGQRVECTDPIPICDLVCGIRLPCGFENDPHFCKQKCHNGKCGPCDGKSTIRCRCGAITETMTCVQASEFGADKQFCCLRKCSKKRLCGRHKCGEICCSSRKHECTALCGRRLTCGLHRCEEPCHTGNCHQCWNVSFNELACFCGAAVRFPPIPCGAKPPECQKLCLRERPCGHQNRHQCHIEPICPPCTELVELLCAGGHELRFNIACHVKEISCGRPCGRMLSCGMHTCQKSCHKGNCETENQPCMQPCQRTRKACAHACAVKCHADEPCPAASKCQAIVTLTCQCGNLVEQGCCLRSSLSTSADLFCLASGSEVNLKSLVESSNRLLECTRDCAIFERNKRMALALEIKNPDLLGKLGNPQYTQFLRDFARNHLNVVSKIEEEFSKLVKASEQSKQDWRRHSFPSMNRDQRRVVHELAEFYGCETQSYDCEPNKNVVATAMKGKCWHPNISLTVMTQRIIHGREVPPPMPSRTKEGKVAMKAAQKINSTTATGNKPPIDYFDMS